MAGTEVSENITRLLAVVALLAIGAVFGILRSAVSETAATNERQDVGIGGLDTRLRLLEVARAANEATAVEIHAAQIRMEEQLSELLRGQQQAAGYAARAGDLYNGGIGSDAARSSGPDERHPPREGDEASPNQRPGP